MEMNNGYRLFLFITIIIFIGTSLALAQGDRPTDKTNSTRSMVIAQNGMVATSQPLAAMAGLRILLQGGNAFDAAVATAAALNVVEPMSTGIGGDMFALAWVAKDKKLVGLNGSGRAGSKASLDFFKQRGLEEIPFRGPLPVTVPGALHGWCTLLEKYGTMSLEQVLAPAIEYAEQGFPVSEIIATSWESAAHSLKDNPNWANNYLIDGRAPQIGEIFKQRALAETFKKLASGGKDVFYKEEIAKKIADFIQEQDGLLTLKDLADHTSTWVEPISTTYKGYEIYELPPNGQGVAVLEMLNILEGYDLKSLGHNSADYLHLLIEAKKLAFADLQRFVADPAFSKLPLETMISKEYASQLRKLININRAAREVKTPLMEKEGDTIYLTVVDKDRNCVSFINSLYDHFGSGLIVPGTGICLQNRGALFSLDPQHPNCIAPGKRPFHTIIPAMVLKDGKPFLCFGVMGGAMQPQGHLQVLLNIIEFGMNVEEAGEAPRFRHLDRGVALESKINALTRYKLISKGHRIIWAVGAFGGYQGILIDPKTGVLYGGSDIRKDGCAVGW
jgi:gamma-glutamyltranspeptidase/glutathione hydrolase